MGFDWTVRLNEIMFVLFYFLICISCLVLSKSAQVSNLTVSLTPNLIVWLILNKRQQIDRSVVSLRFLSQANALSGSTALSCKLNYIVDNTKALLL